MKIIIFIRVHHLIIILWKLNLFNYFICSPFTLWFNAVINNIIILDPKYGLYMPQNVAWFRPNILSWNGPKIYHDLHRKTRLGLDPIKIRNWTKNLALYRSKNLEWIRPNIFIINELKLLPISLSLWPLMSGEYKRE